MVVSIWLRDWVTILTVKHLVGGCLCTLYQPPPFVVHKVCHTTASNKVSGFTVSPLSGGPEVISLIGL